MQGANYLLEDLGPDADIKRRQSLLPVQRDEELTNIVYPYNDFFKESEPNCFRIRNGGKSDAPFQHY